MSVRNSLIVASRRLALSLFSRSSPPSRRGSASAAAGVPRAAHRGPDGAGGGADHLAVPRARRLALINTVIGLIVTYLAFVLPFTIWTLRGFVAGVPKELEEAAMVDGPAASGVLQIPLPLVAPGPGRDLDVRLHPGVERVHLRLRPDLEPGEPDAAGVAASFHGAPRHRLGRVMAGSTLMAIPVVTSSSRATPGRHRAHRRGGERMTRCGSSPPAACCPGSRASSAPAWILRRRRAGSAASALRRNIRDAEQVAALTARCARRAPTW